MPNSQDTARAFYGKAFDHYKKRDLADSMAEWADMSADEQSFTVAHLLYLNLQGQAATVRLLTQVRDLIDEVAEGLTTAIEAGLGAEDDDDGGEAPPADGDAVVDEPPSPAEPPPAPEPTVEPAAEVTDLEDAVAGGEE